MARRIDDLEIEDWDDETEEVKKTPNRLVLKQDENWDVRCFFNFEN